MSTLKQSCRRGALTPWLIAGIFAGGLGMAPAARADDPTPADATLLEQSFRSWLAGLLGPHVPIGERPVTFTAEGDHFVLTLPYQEWFASTGVTIKGDPAVMSIKPEDGGRWSVTEIHAPSPLHVTFPQTGPGAPSEMTLTIDEQDQHGVFDPTLATASNLESTLKGYTTTMSGPEGSGKQTTHLDQMVMHMSWQPGTGGRLNVAQETTGENLTSNSDMPDVGPLGFSADHLKLTAHIDGVATDRMVRIINAVTSMIPLMADDAKGDAKGDNSKLPPAAKPLVHKLLVALSEVMDGFDEQYTMEGVKLDAAGHGGSASKFTGGMAVGAPKGKLNVRFNLGLDGLDLADLPPGPLHAYLPHHIAIAPHFGGVPADGVKALLLHAADSEGNDPKLQDEALALLKKGPAVVGFDELAFDLGPATLAAKAEVKISGTDQYGGTAHIVVTGLDDLIAQAGTEPSLHDALEQAQPVVIMLKGMAKQDGKKTVWDVSYKDKKLLVNGNDMSSMVPNN